MAAAPPLLHVYPVPARSIPDLKTFGCCRSSRVFHAVDSATLQATHRCTPAPYGMTAVSAVLLTHSFGDVDPCLDSDLWTLC